MMRSVSSSCMRYSSPAVSSSFVYWVMPHATACVSPQNLCPLIFSATRDVWRPPPQLDLRTCRHRSPWIWSVPETVRSRSAFSTEGLWEGSSAIGERRNSRPLPVHASNSGGPVVGETIGLPALSRCKLPELWWRKNAGQKPHDRRRVSPGSFPVDFPSVPLPQGRLIRHEVWAPDSSLFSS